MMLAKRFLTCAMVVLLIAGCGQGTPDAGRPSLSSEVATSSSSPTPIPSPSPGADSIPLPIQPTTEPNAITFKNIRTRIRDIPKFAYRNAQKAISENAALPSSLTPIFEVVGTHLNSKNYTGSRAWLLRAIAMYGHFTQPTSVYLFEYAYKDLSEIQKKAAQLIPQENLADSAAMIYGNGNWGVGANCTKDTPMVANTTVVGSIAHIWGGICKGSDPRDARTGIAHEYTHQIQAMQWRRAGDLISSTQPCWPIEGQAVFSAFANLDTFSQYLKIRSSGQLNPYLLSSAGGDVQYPEPHWTAKDVRRYYKSANQPTTCRSIPQFALGYSLGFLTIEALTAIAGPEAHMAVVKEIADGKSLDDAFTAVYGVTWSSVEGSLAEVVAIEIMNLLDPRSKVTYKPLPSTTPKVFNAQEGCGGYDEKHPFAYQARLQVMVGNSWQDVRAIRSGWRESEACSWSSDRRFMAWIEAAIDPGAVYRWMFTGNVNIFARDEYGRGISASQVAE